MVLLPHLHSKKAMLKHRRRSMKKLFKNLWILGALLMFTVSTSIAMAASNGVEVTAMKVQHALVATVPNTESSSVEEYRCCTESTLHTSVTAMNSIPPSAAAIPAGHYQIGDSHSGYRSWGSKNQV